MQGNKYSFEIIWKKLLIYKYSS